MTGHPQSSRLLPIGLMAALGVAFVLALATSAAAVPAIGCGAMTVHHKRYSIRAHVLPCSLARRWSATFLAHGTAPAGYECQRYSPRITRVRFLCVDPSTSTRSDGPRSFNATT
jgi:hypothetical protein